MLHMHCAALVWQQRSMVIAVDLMIKVSAHTLYYLVFCK